VARVAVVSSGRPHAKPPFAIQIVEKLSRGEQVKAFDEALALTGLVITKLDGTAKGGVVAAIAKQHPIPVRFIGVGEGVDDLRPFVASEFVDALVG